MTPFFNVFIRELKEIFKNRFVCFILFLFPFIVCLLLALIFVKGSLKDLPFAVLDLDNSAYTRKIIRMADSTPSVSVKYKVTSLKEGENLIKEGKAYGFLYFPKNFYKDILKGKSPSLVYYYNNQTILIGGIITKDISSVVQNIMAQTNIGLKLKKGLSYKISLQTTNVARIDERLRSNPYLNYSYFLCYVAFIHTYQILITFFSVWAIGREFRYGTTLKWFEIAGKSSINAVFGKILPYTLFFYLSMSITYLLYAILYKAPLASNLIYLSISTIFFILAYQAAGIIFVAITSNMRLSLSISAFYTALGFTLAGMTYPSVAMPAFARYYSGLLPIRPYIKIVVDQTLRDFSFIYDVNYLVWIILIMLLGFSFIPLLKVHMQDRKLWFKL